MSYTVKNFKTKKELKEAVTRLKELRTTASTEAMNPELNRLESNLFLQTLVYPEPQNGQVSLEGPHYPEPHKWYARVEVKDGIVVKVLS